MDLRIECYPQVDSTNSVVKQQIKQGQPEGFVCRAAVQTGGYGRQGRSWVSLAGGSYQSILLCPQRPLEEWPTLTLVVGLAVRRALLELCGVPDDQVFLKWPNDVMSAEGKLVGISCEAQGKGVCVGVGVNVFQPRDEVYLPGKNTAAYLCDLMLAGKACQIIIDDNLVFEDEPEQRVLIEMVSDKVLQNIVERYREWQRDGFSAFLGEYRAVNGILGRFIQLKLIDGGMLTSGQVLDINENGQLVIENSSGAIQAFSGGEVHIL